MKLFGRSKTVARAPLSMTTAMKLAGEIEGVASNGVVSAHSIQELSADLNVPAENLYAGLGMSPVTSIRLEHESQFVVCVGNCRDRGSLDCASTLLEIKHQRNKKSLKSFDMVPRQCLTRCQEGPVVEIRTKDGNAVITSATPKLVARAVKELLE